MTQRLQSAAAKRAMAKARGGRRTLSGLWGGSRPTSPGYHSLAHQPEGGQQSDTGQELPSASPVGVCLMLMVRPFLDWGAHALFWGHSHQPWSLFSNRTSLGAA